MAYGGACRDAGVVACDAGACPGGGTCVADPRSACAGPSCPGVCVSSSAPCGTRLDVDGGVTTTCASAHGACVATQASLGLCDGGRCTSCEFTTGTCDAGAGACASGGFCEATGCGATSCSISYCVTYLGGCDTCAYTSGVSCDGGTACPAGQLCMPQIGCGSDPCSSVCVVP